MEKNMIEVEWIDEERIDDEEQTTVQMQDKTEFRRVREGGRIYLTCVCESDCADEEMMLTDNRPDGYLSVMKKCVNGQILFCYDITGRQPLSGCYHKQPVGHEELASLLVSVKSCLDHAREYLLSEDNLVLNPAYVYRNLTGEAFYFVYAPSLSGTFTEHIRELAKFLMEHVDYREDPAVALAGQFFQYTEAENFSMAVFLEESIEYIEHMGMGGQDEERGEDMLTESGTQREETGFSGEEEEADKGMWPVRRICITIAAASFLAAFSLPENAWPFLTAGACACAAAGILPCYIRRAGRRLLQKERDVFMFSGGETADVSSAGCGAVQSGSMHG